jgi:hypothetical protein
MLEARRISYGGRASVSLSNEKVRTVIDALGGMVPEFSLRRGKAGLNAHWAPPFRGTSGMPWSEDLHAKYWGAKLLYNIAGDFTCSPGFGPPCKADGAELPPHGWTANEEWKLEGCGVDREAGAAFVDFSLESPAPSMPLSWKKRDLVLSGQSAYYSVLDVENRGDAAISINLARHNTIGSPFLESGCRISLSARRFRVAPLGTEFDDTGRLEPGAEFGSLAAAPLRGGGTVDISEVPGMIGATDFVTGPVPRGTSLGWSCVVNPRLRLAYLCFFPGPAATPSGEIALSFNDLWMQYGGRDFTPWALHEGGADLSFCLGTENAVGAYANGLEFSRANPEIMGSPTTVALPPRSARRLCYGVALLELPAELAAEGASEVEVEGSELRLRGKKAQASYPLEADFARIRKLADPRL